MISFRKLGYAPATMPITNALTDTIPVVVMLSHVGTVLPTVVTNDSSPHYLSPALQGFEDRRKNGMGSYISEAELRKLEGEPLALVLNSRIRGATVVNGTLLSTREAVSGPALLNHTPGLTCKSTVYVDGVLVYQHTMATAASPDFTRISTDTYAGVEFYADAATMPAWVSPTNNDCGVLLLWTRER